MPEPTNHGVEFDWISGWLTSREEPAQRPRRPGAGREGGWLAAL